MRRGIIFAALGLLTAITLILAFGFWRESISRTGEAAAVVHGQVITMGEVLDRARPRSKAIDDQVRAYDLQGQRSQASQLALQKTRLPDQLLDRMIEERLIQREANERGLSISPDEVENKIQQFLAEQEALTQPVPTPSPTAESAAQPTAGTPTPDTKLTPTPYPTLVAEAARSAYDSLLNRNGLTDGQFRELVRLELLEEQVRKAVGEGIPTSGPQVHARHILLDSQEKADEVHQRLLDGAEFAELARLESKDPGSRDKGGDLDWFGFGKMNLTFESAAFSLEVGATSNVVESRNGFHIIQVLEKSEDRPFDADGLERQRTEMYRTWISTAQVQPEVKNEMSPERREWLVRQLGGPRRV